MGTYEDKLRAVEKAREGLEAAKQARSEKEFCDEVADLLIANPGYCKIQLDTDVDLPGHIVVKAPKSSASERLRQTMWRQDKDAQAAKARALKALVLDCLVWPLEEKFNELVERHEFVIERAAKECQRLGEAEKEATGKG